MQRALWITLAIVGCRVHDLDLVLEAATTGDDGYDEEELCELVGEFCCENPKHPECCSQPGAPSCCLVDDNPWCCDPHTDSWCCPDEDNLACCVNPGDPACCLDPEHLWCCDSVSDDDCCTVEEAGLADCCPFALTADYPKCCADEDLCCWEPDHPCCFNIDHPCCEDPQGPCCNAPEGPCCDDEPPAGCCEIWSEEDVCCFQPSTCV